MGNGHASVDIKPKPLLYCMNVCAKSSKPVIDNLTQKMSRVFENASATGTWNHGVFTRNQSFRGFHTCACGEQSTANDYLISGGEYVTNSLCVHYLSFHRESIGQHELNVVKSLIG
jgi:hypothetical protein